MSIEVQGMVNTGAMESSDCILCGSCVDTCDAKAIRFRFTSGH